MGRRWCWQGWAVGLKGERLEMRLRVRAFGNQEFVLQATGSERLLKDIYAKLL